MTRLDAAGTCNNNCLGLDSGRPTHFGFVSVFFRKVVPMKNFILVLLSVLFLSSCTYDAYLLPLPPGEKPSLDVRLSSITTPPYGLNTQDIEEYYYDAKGRLARIENENRKRTYLFEYDDSSRLQKRTIIYAYHGVPDTNLVQLFTYDGDGHLSKKEDLKPDGTVVRIYQYDTDDFGRITEQQLLGANGELTFRYEYIWEGDDMVHQKDYAGYDDLMHEWFNEYDDRLNPFCYVMPYPELPQSLHNLVKSTAKDYTGMLDLIANPATYAYEYRPDGLPKKENSNWGRQRVFEYE